MFKRLSTFLLVALVGSLLYFPPVNAAADDYTISGGVLASLPNVGDDSVVIPTITLTDVGGDDFAAEEALVFALNSTDYPSVQMDTATSSGALTIGGTCGHNNVVSQAYGVWGVTITVDGAGGACAAGSTITIDGLYIKTIYTTDAPGAPATNFTIDNSTTSSGNPVDGPTAQLAVDWGDLTSTNVEPSSLAVGETSENVITFTTSIRLQTGSRIVVTYPSGFDISGASSAPTNCSGITCSEWSVTTSSQDLILTKAASTADDPGVITFTVDGIINPTTVGSTGTYSILTKKINDSDGLERDTAVSADTMESWSSTSSGTFVDPTNLAVADYEDGGVMLTWDDPSGDDSTHINIYRGIDPYPVSGTAINSVAIGTEYYIDEDVQEGDTVTYFLRSTDRTNSSDGTDEVTFVVGESTSDDTSDDDTSAGDSSGGDTSTDDSADDEISDDDEISEDDSSDDDIEVPEFSDTEGHWAQDAIEYMAADGIVQGYDDGTFLPSNKLNRAEAAVMLCRLFVDEEPEAPAEDPFDDVDANEWYAPYIAYLKDVVGVLNGNPDGTYTPAENINRAEYLYGAMAVYELLEGEIEDVTITYAYVDLDRSAWYAQAVSNATAMGFVEGSQEEDGVYFNADDDVTRAEAIMILYRMFGE